MRHPCIDIETIKETFDRLEQVDQWLIAGYDAIGRLVRFDVTRIPTRN